MEAPHEITLTRPSDDTLMVRLSGSWTLRMGFASLEPVRQQLDAHPSIVRIAFDTNDIGDWDSTLLTFALGLLAECRKRAIEADRGDLPEGVRRLIDLATAVPEVDVAVELEQRQPFVVRVGTSFVRGVRACREVTEFLGATAIALGRFFRGKARYRPRDLWLTIQQSGADALPIVCLISLLVGLTMAFVGAVQLRPFGAQIYVADLVGLAMAREMGAMMTAIVMAGRTGAAFAAQLGTMTVNEEIDALRTLGISPIEFLVLPRMLALALMMPLLCLFANLMGIAGGAIVGVFMLDIPLAQYVTETTEALSLIDFSQGLIKSAVFGVVVAIAGCLRGMQCGRSSEAVGIATTSAVVTAIVWIILWDSVFAVVFHVLGL